jgi:predicted esterase YcpF (UPF0227 family)
MTMLERLYSALLDRIFEVIVILIIVLSIGGYYAYARLSQRYTLPEPVERPDSIVPDAREYDRLQHTGRQ